MNVDLLTVPYDSAFHALRMGAAPLHLLEHGLISRIEAAAHSVRHVPIERPDGFWTEAQSAFALNGIIARTVKAAAAENRFPLVLSGNCNSAVGALMGRAWILGITILVVGLAGEREDGLMAALLALVAFTVYLATSLVLRPTERNTPRP